MADKNYQGTFAGGQGPVLGQSVKSEEETKGILGGKTGEGHHLREVDGPTPSIPTGSDGLFDLHGKSYAGPDNMVPEDKGEKNPFDINRVK